MRFSDFSCNFKMTNEKNPVYIQFNTGSQPGLRSSQSESRLLLKCLYEIHTKANSIKSEMHMHEITA
jgi:hypothetical protein